MTWWWVLDVCRRCLQLLTTHKGNSFADDGGSTMLGGAMLLATCGFRC
jgi:hypothetical protein